MSTKYRLYFQYLQYAFPLQVLAILMISGCQVTLRVQLKKRSAIRRIMKNLQKLAPCKYTRLLPHLIYSTFSFLCNFVYFYLYQEFGEKNFFYMYIAYKLKELFPFEGNLLCIVNFPL